MNWTEQEKFIIHIAQILTNKDLTDIEKLQFIELAYKEFSFPYMEKVSATNKLFNSIN